ncbi:MAG: acyltransferase family protein [Gemmatimonadota bacterium]
MARRDDIDWLRLLAILLVFVTHAAQVFSPIDDWHIENAEPSRALGQFTVFMGPWLMPLFMMLAGQSAWFALRSRDSGHFLRERLFKLFVPLVAGILVVVPPQVYLRRVSRGEFEGSYFAFYPHFFDGVFPEGNLSWGHLWFLAYLFAYTVVGLPAFRFLQSPRGRRWLGTLSRACDWPGGILWLFLPLALGQILLRPYFTRTTGAVVGDWATHAWFFPVYVLGFAVMLEPRLGQAIGRDWRSALFPAVLTSLGLFLFAQPGNVYERIPADPSLWHITFWTGFTLSTWSWLVFLTGAAREYLAFSSPSLRYWGDRVYPFYVFHQTAIVIVAFYVVQWPLPIAGKFLVILGLSFAGTVLVLEAVGRIPRVRGLFGLRETLPGASPVRLAER